MEQFEIKQKVFCIAHTMQECRYWHDTEQDENYLHSEGVEYVGFHSSHKPYISKIIDELFSYITHEHNYGYDLSYVVCDNSNDWHIPSEVFTKFLQSPLVAVSEPKYTGGYSSKYEFEEGSYISPDALLDYLKSCDSHGLDLDEVSKIFAIGDYEHLREDQQEQS